MAGEIILIVDDDIRNVDFLQGSLLASAGYTTLCAADGKEALRLALTREPDLILLDLQMPKMDGFEVLEALQKEGRQIPTILITAHGSESVAVQAFRLGVRDYFVKPFRIAEIMRAVDRSLAEARLRREKGELTESVRLVNRQLEQRLKELRILYEISKSVSSLLDLDEVLIRIVEAAAFLTAAEEVSLFLLDARTRKIHLRATKSLNDRRARRAHTSTDDPAVRECLNSSEVAIKQTPGEGETGPARSTVTVPLKVREVTIGALCIQWKSDAPLADGDRYLLSALAEYAAIAIDNARLYEAAQAELTQRKKAEEAIKKLAYHDTLTGLPNRTLFNDRLGVALARARRYRHKVAVLLLDLDRFKEVNDRLGHSVGDQLLRAAGQRLVGVMRESDTVCRMGGDEFLLLLPEMESTENATQAAERILRAIREPFVLDSHSLLITTSIGIATYPDDGNDGDTLVKNADIAMYHAKDMGRDNYQRYAPQAEDQPPPTAQAGGNRPRGFSAGQRRQQER
ncbi:MAG TPA: diguanylate cyclase [Anaerolineae bacterium]|nr:diguanylate cyclase [Anaerolineae bacterium]